MSKASFYPFSIVFTPGSQGHAHTLCSGSSDWRMSRIILDLSLDSAKSLLSGVEQIAQSPYTIYLYLWNRVGVGLEMLDLCPGAPVPLVEALALMLGSFQGPGQC